MNNQENELLIKRFDNSRDRSLRAHSAADEFLLQVFNELEAKPSHTAIYNDRFGFLSCHLHAYNTTSIISKKNQQKAIDLNLKANKLASKRFSDPLANLEEKIDFALIKAPKSLDLLDLFLQQIAQNAAEEVTIVIAFMTRHFTPKLIAISEKYFEEVIQSRAVKKSRVITLTKMKKVAKVNPIHVLEYNEQSYKQYWGVFSGKHIDYATQYLIEHLVLEASDSKILDLGSGNGIIAKEILKELPEAELHLIDDSFLAVESAKLNLEGDNIFHHYDNDLSNFEEGSFDLIVTNPPFHIEYEISIQVTLELFKECHRCLKREGNLQVVANRHLNYMTHLRSIFSSVEIIAENDKFEIYKCVK